MHPLHAKNPGHQVLTVLTILSNHVIALHKRVVLIACHGCEGVIDVAMACLVSTHIHDQVPHSRVLHQKTLLRRILRCVMPESM